MNIFIAGGFGSVGSALIPYLEIEGYKLFILDRSPEKNRPIPDGAKRIIGDSTKPGSWQNELHYQDVIINLVGETIFKRWNERIKKHIYNSRIFTTRNIVEAISNNTNKQKILINASATGYYGYEGNRSYDEEDNPGNDFLATVSADWENEALKAEKYNTRVVCLRFATVLGRHGGAMELMIPIFNLALGSKLGSGQQWFPWIHEQDLVRIIHFAINNNISGPVNCSSPETVTNEDFTRALAKSLRRPVIIPFVPSIALRIVLGEFGKILLNGQRIVPKKIVNEGFKFQYPELKLALEDLSKENKY